MNNVLLYIVAVLIWGSTWLAIKPHVGPAPVEISILYRSVIALVALWLWCGIRGISLKTSKRDHVFFFALGVSMFSAHHIFIYAASKHVVSGIVALVFSSVSLFNVLHNYLFFKVKPTLNVVVGVMLGILGIGVFFYEDVVALTLQDRTVQGLVLTTISAFIFSFSSMITKRNQTQGLEDVACMALGMVYGVGLLLIYVWILGLPFACPRTSLYWSAVSYLGVFGSVLAPLCYLKMIKNLGAEQASYAVVLFPIVALGLSSIFEDYQWSTGDLVGLALVTAGGILLRKKKEVSS